MTFSHKSSRRPHGPAGGQQLARPGSKEKTSFRDKLQQMIFEAESSKTTLLKAKAAPDVKSLCVTTLVEGRPQAFVEFFYLTHKEGGSSGAAGSSGQDGGEPAVLGDDHDADSLLLMKTELVNAEAAQRCGNAEGVYSAYTTLAGYFQDLGRFKKAAYFYEKCLHEAKRNRWIEGELSAITALGRMHENLDDIHKAINCFERKLELAEHNLLDDEVAAAHESLTQVYSKLGDQLEREKQVEQAINVFHKCLAAAQASQNDMAANRVLYRLGILNQHLGHWAEAIPFHEQVLQISRRLGDRLSEGKAHCAIAESQQRMGEVDGATQSLETYLELSKLEDPQGQAIASCNLGIIYYQQQHFELAVTYFEKFFELARILHDKRILDTARVNLGVARAAVRMKAFVNVVRTDFDALLNWKNGRLHFADPL